MDSFDDEDGNEIFEDGENLEVSNEAIETKQDKNEDENDDAQEEERKQVKPKRVIKHPRAKLNAELLKGPKGLGNLEKCFERVQFKGKGYEEQDLNVLLKTYEYWCHRLFPKFPFKDCIDKIEKLGSKGPIQTHLRKVRSGLVDEDEIVTTDALPDFGSDEEDDSAPSTSAQTTTQAVVADIPIELTEEQLETIRRNREKAEKLRQERLRKIQEKAAVNLPEKNVFSEASTSSRVLDTADDDLEIQSNPAQDRTVSSGKNFSREDSSERKNGEDSGSEDEFQFSKRKAKKPSFEDDEEEEESIRTVEKEANEEDRNEDIRNEESCSNLSKNGDIVQQMEMDE